MTGDLWFPQGLVQRYVLRLSSGGRFRPCPPSWWWLAGRRSRRRATPLPPRLPPPPPPCQQRCPYETRRTEGSRCWWRLRVESRCYSQQTNCCYLHRVDNDGEGGVIPLAAPLLGPTPGAFSSTVDRANSEDTQDHHDDQETHTHHDDDCSRSWNHCNKNENDYVSFII